MLIYLDEYDTKLHYDFKLITCDFIRFHLFSFVLEFGGQLKMLQTWFSIYLTKYGSLFSVLGLCESQTRNKFLVFSSNIFYTFLSLENDSSSEYKDAIHFFPLHMSVVNSYKALNARICTKGTMTTLYTHPIGGIR